MELSHTCFRWCLNVLRNISHVPYMWMWGPDLSHVIVPSYDGIFQKIWKQIFIMTIEKYFHRFNEETLSIAYLIENFLCIRFCSFGKHKLMGFQDSMAKVPNYNEKLRSSVTVQEFFFASFEFSPSEFKRSNASTSTDYIWSRPVHCSRAPRCTDSDCHYHSLTS